MIKALNRANAGITQTYPEKVVQFGGGNFLRAFVDTMIDQLNAETDFDASVVVVKASPAARPSHDLSTLTEQDGLFHVVLNGIRDGQVQTNIRLVKCVSRVLDPYTEREAFLALAQQEGIRFIVSNTTEAGIIFDETAEFDETMPDNFPAKVTIFLYERYQHFNSASHRGCIILPCELIEDNGTQLKKYVLDYARLWGLEAGFVEWLEQHNTFCNTLVDRIVVGYPKDRADALMEQIGYDDKLLVEGELYHSFVIEAPESVQAELPTHKTNLNVQFVSDIQPYRDMKVRILNGTHTAMTPTAYLYGLRTVRESIEDEIIGNFIHDLLFAEVLLTLNFPEEYREQFARDVLERFRNPYLKHELRAIALNSISKFKARLLPSLLDYVRLSGTPPQRIMLAFAALIRFYKGEWQGESLPVNDDAAVIEWFCTVWDESSIPELVEKVLSNQVLWGQDLSGVNGLNKMLIQYLEQIETKGMKAVLEAIG
jgi:tagaturonate reductase